MEKSLAKSKIEFLRTVKPRADPFEQRQFLTKYGEPFSPSNHLSRESTGYGPTDSYAGCFRMTPRTCRERLPAVPAAQLCISTIVGFIELREAFCATTPTPKSRMLTCPPQRTLRAIAASRRWRRGCPTLPNQGLVKSLAGQGANPPAESRVEIIRRPLWPLAPVTWRESHVIS